VPNTGLAEVSNATLVTAIVLYAMAMLAYALDFAFGRRSPATASAEVPRSADVNETALVGAPAGSELAGHRFPADPADPTELADLGPAGRNGTGPAGSPGAAGQAGQAGPARAGLRAAAARPAHWPQGQWLRGAFALMCMGLAFHIAAITTRGLAEHRVPWGNMYEFIAAITCAAVLVLALASVRFGAYFMGLFVLLPVVIALAVDVTVIYTPAGELVPALQSYWIAIHVTAMIIAMGMFIFGAVVTVLYLLVSRHERRVAEGKVSGGGVLALVPSSDLLDRLSYRSILFAFPAWTFAVIAGAIWADHAWGRYWGWDPKETWSFIVWVVYAAFLHARATIGWRGRRAAVIHLVGFACLLFNLVGVNLWVTGLHSYAGMH
jgi:cytochrome c-type biogenesis protein CcsB